MSDSSSELLLILAPTGAGATTRARSFGRTDRSVTHIEIKKIVDETSASLGLNLKEAQKESCARVSEAAHALYREDLQAALKTRNKVVVDYVSDGEGEWLKGTVSEGRASGRTIVVEGVFAHPQTGLSRKLQRDTYGMSARDVYEAVTDPVHVRGWLASYQRFPGFLAEAIQQADKGVLLDNSAFSEKPDVIAEWARGSGGLPRVEKPAAFQAFSDLTSLDLAAVPYSVEVAYSMPQGDDYMYGFDIKPREPSTKSYSFAPRYPRPLLR